MAFPVTEDKILAAEETLGRRLPETLRERLLQNNGGEVIDNENNDWILHPVRDDSDRKRLVRTANDIIRETESAREWDNFPENAIAIANDGTGDLIILLPDDDAFYIWSHEDEPLIKTELEDA
ncbi:SMI1/KNR4 family protein [Corynebacterium glutamicum]|uniref:SMI1/KNR4 family protein n=1 Tax=Corynebacterium glutamicum TaxID=1718 RepID=UPI0014680E31|nr:SMI1/KNR4 family protein [Corynebacterium glutamicum]GFK18439.1 SMI1/KNR4 family protein [Corynebacterium glutamicum]